MNPKFEIEIKKNIYSKFVELSDVEERIRLIVPFDEIEFLFFWSNELIYLFFW